ncbi:MAG: hypothetical protein RR766_00185 [Longicatena sp.]
MDGIIDNLINAINTWNEKLAEIWVLLTQSPQEFKGGHIWDIIVKINGALMAIGIALLVLFFAVGMVKTCSSFTDVKKPEHAVKLFVRFAIARALVVYGMEIMMKLFEIIQGILSTIMNAVGVGMATSTTLPKEIIDAVDDCGFMASIPLWAVSLLGGIFITVLAFVMILTVYGRFFKLYMYTAISPIPFSCCAGESTQSIMIAFTKSYIGVCMEGVIIVLACVIFSAFAGAPPVDVNASAVSMVWTYIAELIFNMLILVGTVKMSDRIVKEMMGL